jgi:hypothetical protein
LTRYFTVNEANALLPRLTEMLDALRRLRDQAILKKAQVDLLWRRLETGDAVLGSIGDQQRELDDVTARFVSAARDVERTGCVLRDVDAGLVDFPCRAPGGATVFLCWRLDETAVEYWHGAEEGFAGRKPIAQLPPDTA